SYRRTRIAHLRRRVRLIAMACLFVAVAWLLLLVLPRFADAEPLIADNWLDLLTGVVPLAYLVGGVAPDLYRIDRIALRLGFHAATIAVLAGMLAAAGAAFSLHGTAAVLWAAVTFVALYRPIQQVGRRLLPVAADPTHAH